MTTSLTPSKPAISVARFSPKTWIKIDPRFVRYKTFNKTDYSTGRRINAPAKHGVANFVYDYGDTLSFYNLGYSRQNDGKFNNSKSQTYKLKVKNGRVNLYTIEPKKIRNCSTKPARIERLFKGYADRPIKAGQQRFNAILKNFLKRNGIKFKYSSRAATNILAASYPALRSFKDAFNYSSPIPSEVSRVLREYDDFRKVIRRCFGSSGRTLCRLVYQHIEKYHDLNVLYLGLLLKKKLKVDHFHTILTNMLDVARRVNIGQSLQQLSLNDDYKQCILSIINTYSNTRLVRLFSSDLSRLTPYCINDTVYLINTAMMRNIQLPPSPASWIDLHDTLVTLTGRNSFHRLIEDVDLPINDKYKEINGCTYEDFVFEVPNNTSVLEDYSNKMSNCIRGYGRRIVSGGCNVLGVYKNKELMYNISISSQAIEQFKTKHNLEPNNRDRDKIVLFLKEKGIIL